MADRRRTCDQPLLCTDGRDFLHHHRRHPVRSPTFQNGNPRRSPIRQKDLVSALAHPYTFYIGLPKVGCYKDSHSDYHQAQFYTKSARDTPKKVGIASTFAMFLHSMLYNFGYNLWVKMNNSCYLLNPSPQISL